MRALERLPPVPGGRPLPLAPGPAVLVLVVIVVVIVLVLPGGFHLHQPLLGHEHVQCRLRLADPELVLVRPLEVRAEVNQVHPRHGAGAAHGELLLLLLLRAPVPAAVCPPLDEPLQSEAEVRHLVRPRAARPRGVGLGDAVAGPVHDAVVLDEPAAGGGRFAVGRFTPRVVGVVRRGERHGGDLEVERGHQAVVDQAEAVPEVGAHVGLVAARRVAVLAVAARDVHVGERLADRAVELLEIAVGQRVRDEQALEEELLGVGQGRYRCRCHGAGLESTSNLSNNQQSNNNAIRSCLPTVHHCCNNC